MVLNVTYGRFRIGKVILLLMQTNLLHTRFLPCLYFAYVKKVYGDCSVTEMLMIKISDHFLFGVAEL